MNLPPCRCIVPSCLVVLLLLALAAGEPKLCAADAPKKHFDVPAEAASAAIKDFSEQSGIEVLYGTQLVERITTNRVQGDMTPYEALNGMLDGTGLEVVQSDQSGALTIRKARNPDPKAVGTALAVDNSSRPNLPPTTSSADTVVKMNPFDVIGSSNTGYGAASTSSGRLQTAYIDIPQSSSVVTAELLKDQNEYSTLDALTYSPNITVISQHDPVFSIRGLQTNRNYFDGFFVANTVTVDTAFTDRIEVVKGPSTTAFGRGDPAGFVNFVSKQPLFTYRTEANVTFGFGGQQNDYRFTVDNNGFVTPDGQTAYRLVVSYSKGSTTRDYSDYERRGALLAVTHKLGDRGDLQLITNLFRNRDAGGVGNLSYNDPSIQKAYLISAGNTLKNIPILNTDFVYGMDGIGDQDNDAGATLIFTYKLNDFISTRQAFHYSDANSLDIWSGSNAGTVQQAADGTFTVQVTPLQQKFLNQGWSYQSDFNVKAESPFLSSSAVLLFGGDITDDDSIVSNVGASSATQSAAYPRQPMFNFNPHIAYAFAGNIDKLGTLNTGYEWSPYAQLQLNALHDMIQISGAGRVIYTDENAQNLATNVITPNKGHTPLLTTVSVLYKPAKNLSFYAIESKYQTPSSIVPGFTGLPAGDPRANITMVSSPTTELHEAGIKSNFLDGKLTVSVDAFRMTNSGSVLFSIIDNTNFIFQNFLTNNRATGWEVEVFGQPTKKLTLDFGAGFIASQENIPQGLLVYYYPLPGLANTVYGLAKYAFGSSLGNGLSATAGAKVYLSGWNANVTGIGSPGNIPYPTSNTVANFGLAYAIKDGRYRASVNVDNALHKDATLTGGYQNIASGRTVYLSLDVHF